MKKGLSTTERIAVEKLRAQVVSARRWHHADLQNLDTVWASAPAELAARPPNHRAVHIELLRRTIAKLTACVPPSVIEPEPNAGAPATSGSAADASPT